MIEIKKEEAEYLRQQFKDVSIVKTKPNKGARRGKRYVEDSPFVLKALRKFQQDGGYLYGKK